MSLDQIRYFVAVAEAGSTREAAARLRVSQPPLSRQIKALEYELAATLFERSARGMRLLPAGTAFLAGAREVLRALDVAKQSVLSCAAEVPIEETSPPGQGMPD